MAGKKKLADLLDVPLPTARALLDAVQSLCEGRGGGRPRHSDIVAAVQAGLRDLPAPAARTRVRRTVVKGTARNEPAPEAPAPLRLIIESRRGTLDSRETKRPCDRCGTPSRTLWRYARSNRGEVRICGRCKPTVFDQSFGSVDASRVTVDSRLLQHDHRDGKREGIRPR